MGASFEGAHSDDGRFFASFLEGWAPNSAASQQAEKHPIPPQGKGRHNPVPDVYGMRFPVLCEWPDCPKGLADRHAIPFENCA